MFLWLNNRDNFSIFHLFSFSLIQHGIVNKSAVEAEYVEVDQFRDQSDLKWEFPRNKLKFVAPLGSGQFAQVHKGVAKGLKPRSAQSMEVAVKLLKGKGTPNLLGEQRTISTLT